MKLVFSALCVAVIGLTGTVTEASMIHAVGVDNQNTAAWPGRIPVDKLVIFRRDTGHRVKDLILIRNEVRDEEGKKETQR